jgi:ligand-binding sensor domain-containing protein
MAKKIKLIIISLLCLSTSLLAQEEWQLIEAFEGEGLKQGGVSAIPTLEDKYGNIWFVTNSGNIYQFANQEIVSTNNLACSTPLKQKKLHNEDCFKLFKGPQDALWLTSKNKGISKFKGNEWVNLSDENRSL